MEIDNRKVLISAIIVALVVLVSFNFEKMTGQATVTKNIRDIKVVGGTSAGSTVDIIVTPKIGTMDLGKEQLWFKGPGIKRNLDHKCTKWLAGTGTNKCREAQIENFWIPSDASGIYYFTVEKSTGNKEILGTSQPVTI